MATPGLTGDCLTLDGFAATLPGYAGLGGSSADEPADRAIQVLDLIVDLIKFQDMLSICWRESWGKPWQPGPREKFRKMHTVYDTPCRQTNWQSAAMWQGVLNTLRELSAS
jgi:hypothetical protein